MTCQQARGTLPAPRTAYRVTFQRGPWARIEVTACGTTPQEATDAAQRALWRERGDQTGLVHVETREVTP